MRQQLARELQGVKAGGAAVDQPSGGAEGASASVVGAHEGRPSEQAEEKKCQSCRMDGREIERKSGADHHQEEEPGQRKSDVTEIEDDAAKPDGSEGGSHAGADSEAAGESGGGGSADEAEQKRSCEANGAVAAKIVGTGPVLMGGAGIDIVAILLGVMVGRAQHHDARGEREEEQDRGSDQAHAGSLS